MKAKKTKKTSVKRVGKRFITLYALAMTGTYAALVTPVVVTMALRLAQIDPTNKATNLSLILGSGALFALIANPFFGKLSDRTTSRLGMRRPWIIGGGIVGLIALLVISSTNSIPIIVVSWCIAQIGFNALLAALTAILPDQVPVEQRGSVSGIVGVSSVAGILIGLIAVQITGGTSFSLLAAPGIIGVALVMVFTFSFKDRHLAKHERKAYAWSDFFSSYWVNPFKYRDFAWAWIGRALLYLGLATLSTYQAYYLTDHLHFSATAVTQAVFLALIVTTLFTIASSILAGILSDRVHRRKPFVIFSALLFAVALFFIATAQSYGIFLIAVALAGIAQGAYTSIDLALVSQVLPDQKKEAGKDLGIINIANALPQSLAPAIAPIFLAIHGPNNYTSLFIAAACFGIIGALALQPIRGVK